MSPTLKVQLVNKVVSKHGKPRWMVNTEEQARELVQDCLELCNDDDLWNNWPSLLEHFDRCLPSYIRHCEEVLADYAQVYGDPLEDEGRF